MILVMGEKVALITGGAKRVGRAIVEKFAADGFRVAFTYLSSQADAESLARQIDGCAIRTDLTRPAEAVLQVNATLSAFANRLDVLVNSASIYAQADLRQTTPPVMQQLMAIHVQAPLLLAQEFETQLRQSRGHIINMVDLLAEKPWPQYLAYCTSKAALANLTLGLARDLAPEVTVNGIAPGVVEWPANYPEGEKQKYLNRVPLNRSGTPQDVANLAHFLATNGSYITGQIIHLDGGRSIT